MNDCGASTISKNANLRYDEVNAVIKERGQRILERFGKVATVGVTNCELLAILDDVKAYWRDWFRPALTSFSCEAVGGKPGMAEDAGLMFTLASAGFGIHDDVIDKYPSKHLRRTILGLHGVDSALLVGDLLMAKAWTVVHEMIRKTSQPMKIAEIVEAYGNASIEICEAEFMETFCRKKLEISIDYYKKILWKAMAEIEACTRIGAICGNGRENEVQALSEFGRRLGFISRLADDVTDCLNIKGDLLHRIQYESTPLPLLFAAKTSKENYDKIRRIFEKSFLTPEDAKTLLKICFETDAFRYILKTAKQKEREANRNLCSLRQSRARNFLALMVSGAYSNLVGLCQ